MSGAGGFAAFHIALPLAATVVVGPLFLHALSFCDDGWTLIELSQKVGFAAIQHGLQSGLDAGLDLVL
jgi:hypothetical protein